MMNGYHNYKYSEMCDIAHNCETIADLDFTEMYICSLVTQGHLIGWKVCEVSAVFQFRKNQILKSND